MTMVSDTECALAEATSGDVHFCYLSSSIVLEQKDRKFLESIIGEFRKVLINRDSVCGLKTINAVDAFFGTLPGNGVAQVRRVIAHTRNYVDLMPISAVWAGEKKNPSSLMPPDSPPLLYAATQGGVPYPPEPARLRRWAHASYGPTGAGKSVSLALFVAQWFRYPNAQVFAFDKGIPCTACAKQRAGAFMTRRRRAVLPAAAGH